MERSKRVSTWSVEEVLGWVQELHPAQAAALQKAIIKHQVSGRALLRLKENHLEALGLQDPPLRQELMQDLLLLRVQEEAGELDDVCAEWFSS